LSFDEIFKTGDKLSDDASKDFSGISLTATGPALVIVSSEFLMIPNAAHIASIEQESVFNSAM